MSELDKKWKSEILLESFKKNELKEFNKFINFSKPTGKAERFLNYGIPYTTNQ